jgi:hypothetical protein
VTTIVSVIVAKTMIARHIHFIIDSIREVFSLACSVREGRARLALALVS